MARLTEIGGRRLPFLRWSFLRMLLGIRKLTTDWQVGDGREEALREYVLENARAGDLDDVIRVVDEFCYERSFMINVGDEKGELLDAALRKADAEADPRARDVLRLQRAAHGARDARRRAHRSIEFVRGQRGDRARDLASTRASRDRVDRRRRHARRRRHDARRARAPSTASAPARSTSCSSTTTRTPTCPTRAASLERGWLHPGSVLVADNVKFPGAPGVPRAT